MNITDYPALVLKPGREKSLLRRHPWVFTGALSQLHGDPGIGDTVQVLDSKGEFLAWGGYSPHSSIIARIWSWQRAQEINPAFFRERLYSAVSLRRKVFPVLFDHYGKQGGFQSGLRLVHAESDGLPGFVADQYADTLVVQVLAACAERWMDVLVDELAEFSASRCVYERSDVEARSLEGLPLRTGVLRGKVPEERIQISSGGLRFWVNVGKGHKTGFYLDQLDNRQRVRMVAASREVLDCFCYTGGFTIAALAGGAKQVTAVDSSVAALALARENVLLNNLNGELVTWVEADVFRVLREMRDRGRTFDMVVLDPPKFAQTASQAQRAARGYKDINLLAFKLLRPGGLLVTFSCSGGVSEDLFQKIVASAALDAGVRGLIIEKLSQSPDHPVALKFPEGSYLKGLVVYQAGLL